MKLCTCNNCNWIYEDKNPQVGAKEYPDDVQIAYAVHSSKGEITVSDALVWGRDIDDLELAWICPICRTDGFLTDTVNEDKIKIMI